MINVGGRVVDVMLWCLLAWLVGHLQLSETRMEEVDSKYKSMETHTQSTEKPKPEPPRIELKPEKCFYMSREDCPTEGRCKRIEPDSVFCCDVDSFRLKEALAITMTQQNTTKLHVLNATIDELDVSQSIFRRLTSMALTDGNIGKIVGQFPKYSSIACLNISNNNLSSATLQPPIQRPFAYLFNLTVLDASRNNLTEFPLSLVQSNRKISVDLSEYSSIACLNISNNNLSSATLQPPIQRPFAYLFNLTVLDASRNNLTEFPLSLVQSNRKISVDLSGNNYLPCKHFLKVMETNNSSLVTFLNYDKTFCALGLRYWFKEALIVPIDHLRLQKELNISCSKIRPENINCTCLPDRLELMDGVTNLVAVLVDCSQRHLKEMPTNLPPNTAKLNVSYNNITSLQPVSDPSYEHVRQLLVDHNDVASVVDLEGTKFIDNFMVFSITHNKLKTIHTYVLSNRFETMGPSLLISGNYIHCDCNTEKVLKPWLLENLKNIPDYKDLKCENNMGSVVDLRESQVCHTPRDWTDYIYYIIGLEVLVLVLLVSKVSYDYWVFKTAGYLPWPANKMPRLPCDWLCE